MPASTLCFLPCLYPGAGRSRSMPADFTGYMRRNERSSSTITSTVTNPCWRRWLPNENQAIGPLGTKSLMLESCSRATNVKVAEPFVIIDNVSRQTPDASGSELKRRRRLPVTVRHGEDYTFEVCPSKQAGDLRERR